MTKVLKFWAPWCGPCKTSAPIVKEAAQAANVELEEVNIDEPEGNKLANDYRVKSIPTVIILKNGVEEGRIVGKRTYTEYRVAFE